MQPPRFPVWGHADYRIEDINIGTMMANDTHPGWRYTGYIAVVPDPTIVDVDNDDELAIVISDIDDVVPVTTKRPKLRIRFDGNREYLAWQTRSGQVITLRATVLDELPLDEVHELMHNRWGN